MGFNSEEFQMLKRLEWLEKDFYQLEAITDKWGFIRQVYMELLPYIIEASREWKPSHIIPYAINWTQYFSPIEARAWQSIRTYGVPLYPQFPVFNYFIDFANPYLRIGLEMDGKDYHDPDKDRGRDELLWRHGWRIFRVPGREAYVKFKSWGTIQNEFSESQDEQQRDADLEHWLMNTDDGVIYALNQVYCTVDSADDGPAHPLFYETLDKHRLASFPLTD